MDGSIDGKSSLRFVKEKNIVSKKNFILFTFLLFTTLFTWRSFEEINPVHLFIEGDKFITKKDLIANSSLKFPKKLIFIKTKLLEKELKESLALKNISISRRLVPFGLKIYFQTRVPLAYAESNKLDKKVYGYIDSEGVFIPQEFANIKEVNVLPIKIIGWKENFREIISKILKLYERNINELELIYIASDEFIFLEDKLLKRILLGYEHSKIDNQLKLVNEIKKQLTQRNFLEKVESLDITDPNNPKIKVFKP